jgi:hypothetical protein
MPAAAKAESVTIPHDPIHFHRVIRMPRAQAWMYTAAATQPTSPGGIRSAAASGQAERPL